jgi:hypothetical protein
MHCSPKSALPVLTLLAAVMLSGCNESSPSESTVEKQITAQYGNCALLSVHGFKKINGYPQQDGSYVVSVKYTLKLEPSSKAKQLADEYEAKHTDIVARATESRRPFVEELQPKMDALQADMAKKCGSRTGENLTGNPECAEAKKTIDDFVAETNWNQRATEAQSLVNQANAFPQTYRDQVEQAFIHDCRMIALGGVMDGYFGASHDRIENYSKEFTATMEGNLRFINSDNGWVIKN